MRSRSRLLRLFASLQWDRFQGAYFVTLTYHEAWRAEEHDVQRDLNALLTRLRATYPGWHYVWRLELQLRGAPHFHLVLLPPLDVRAIQLGELKAWMKATWSRIADPSSVAHRVFGTQVDEVTSYRRAAGYVSKYVAKEDEVLDASYHGRRWGTSRDLPCAPLSVYALEHADWRAVTAACRRILRARGVSGKKWLSEIDRQASIWLWLPAEEHWKLLSAIAEFSPGWQPRGPTEELERVDYPCWASARDARRALLGNASRRALAGRPAPESKQLTLPGCDVRSLVDRGAYSRP